MNNGRRVADAQQAGKCMVGGFVTRPSKAVQPFRQEARFPNGDDLAAVHQCLSL
jgi:hypothetical protein